MSNNNVLNSDSNSVKSKIRKRSKNNALEVLDFKRNLRSRRIALELTHAEVAERMGSSVRFVENFERYDSNPTMRDIQRYANAVDSFIKLSVNPDDEN